MNKETKTIREWFEGLPVGYREIALSNLENFPIDSDCRDASSLSDALDSGFWWADTPEGEDFWDAVHKFVSYVAPKPPKLPPLPTSGPAENPLLQALRDAMPFVDMATAFQTGVISEPAKALAARIRAILGEQPSATES